MIDDVKALADDARVVGTNETLDLLRRDELTRVFLASNAPSDVADDVKRYAELNGTECVTLDAANDELGLALRKPFNVAVVGEKA